MVKELAGIRSASLPESICSGGSILETGEDEEFYEKIEAPKFVDFTAPDHHRPDDRYWFCLRVGCEQKHEEEMDSEKIYKDFVLRVMAARSPNVKLQKALNRFASRNMKCPMTVPSKYSKPRLSRLAVASSISRKLGYEKEKAKPPTNPMSTPKTKTKQVAAKYLTTPRSKKSIPDANSFRSVQNPKPTTIAAVSKNRMAAKALVFPSPKKAISLKKSVELRIPLTKLCEGMKKLEITSQKKRLLAHSNRSLKDAGEKPLDITTKTKSSKKDNRVAKAPSKSQPKAAEKVKQVKSVKGKKECILKEIVENEIDKQQLTSTGECNDTESPQIEANLSSEPLSTAPRCLETEDISNEGSEKETDENSEHFKNHSTEILPSEVQNHETQSTESDDKENAVSADENRTLNDNKIQTKILGEQTNAIKKIIKPADKTLSGLKFKKIKPTNPKPFRLRTDERSILKESNFERKGHHPDPPSGNLLRKNGADTKGNVESTEQQNGGAGSNCKGKESSDNDSSLINGSRTEERTKISRGKVGSKTPKRPNASKLQEQKPMPSSPFERSARSATRKVKFSSPLEKRQVMSQRLALTKKTMASPSPGRNLAVTDKNSSSRGKRRVTAPKEPHFHTTHVPKSCTRNWT